MCELSVDQDDVRVLVQRLDAGLPLPAYACDGDAGLDLRARADAVLAPGRRALVPTGVAVALPDGYVGLVHPRSGLAARHGVTIVNAPGTVDSGYRGEILINLINLDPNEPFALRRGDRIAQLVVQRYARAELVEVSALPPSERGAGGHGASGGFGPGPRVRGLGDGHAGAGTLGWVHGDGHTRTSTVGDEQ